jgi:hypothetical protein
MPVTPPTAAELASIAQRYGLHLSGADLESFRARGRPARLLREVERLYQASLPAQRRDLHAGAQFGAGELLVDRVVQFGQHPAGGAHLDQPGPAAELLADRPHAAGYPVGEAERAVDPGAVLDPVERVGVQVAWPPVVDKMAPAR